MKARQSLEEILKLKTNMHIKSAYGTHFNYLRLFQGMGVTSLEYFILTSIEEGKRPCEIGEQVQNNPTKCTRTDTRGQGNNTYRKVKYWSETFSWCYAHGKFHDSLVLAKPRKKYVCFFGRTTYKIGQPISNLPKNSKVSVNLQISIYVKKTWTKPYQFRRWICENSR